MTDPMPTIENILGFPARTNTPDHRKIAERLLDNAEKQGNVGLKSMSLRTAEVHAILALADDLQHLHDDISLALTPRQESFASEAERLLNAAMKKRNEP